MGRKSLCEGRINALLEDGWPAGTAVAVATDEPIPDFEKCHNCGADALTSVFWNPTGGWGCHSCGAFDYPEAAE